MHGNTTEIGCAHGTRIRMRLGRHHIDKRFIGITLLVERLKVGFGHDLGIKRRMNATNQGRQVRNESQPDRSAGHAREPLANLRQVTMARYAVRFEIIGRFGEQ